MRRIIAAVCLAVMAIGLAAQRTAALPLVYIAASSLGNEFSAGSFTLMLNGDTLLHSMAQLRYRGASSLRYEKKSFGIKLTNDNGTKRNEQLLDMRRDNYWILDAAAIDMSRMRNRVTMDLWIDFSRKPQWFENNKTVANGTRGRFVEVYVNGSYNGVYCLSERIDRKQLGLDKWDEDTRQINGYMIKAKTWAANTCMQSSINNQARDAQATWGGFDAAYPDAEDGEPWSWQPITQFLRKMSSCSIKQLETMADSLFDIDVFADYILLTYLVEAEDNMAKNYYLSRGNINDAYSKWFLTPWDLDHSWGRRYDSTQQVADSVFARLLEHNYLARRLNKYCDTFFERLCTRWHVLRRGAFGEEKLVEPFRHYAILLERSGAWKRERERWAGTQLCPPPIDQEVEYISQWIHRRLEVLDEFFNNVTSSPSYMFPTAFYNLDGRLIREKDMKPGRIYILRQGHKAHKFLYNPQ